MAFPGQRQMDRANWLAERRLGIGGSDIAILLGLNPWKSEQDLIMDKLDLIPQKDQFQGNEATRAGNRLEPFVADWYAERHHQILINGDRVVSTTNPRFIGNTDFLYPEGILEIKTGAEKSFNAGCPEQYRVQVLWYMMITERPEGTLCACIVPKDRKEIPEDKETLKGWIRFRPLREYQFRREPMLEEKMTLAGERFLKKLDALREPRAGGLQLVKDFQQSCGEPSL